MMDENFKWGISLDATKVAFGDEVKDPLVDKLIGSVMTGGDLRCMVSLKGEHLGKEYKDFTLELLGFLSEGVSIENKSGYSLETKTEENIPTGGVLEILIRRVRWQDYLTVFEASFYNGEWYSQIAHIESTSID